MWKNRHWLWLVFLLLAACTRQAPGIDFPFIATETPQSTPTLQLPDLSAPIPDFTLDDGLERTFLPMVRLPEPPPILPQTGPAYEIYAPLIRNAPQPVLPTPAPPQPTPAQPYVELDVSTVDLTVGEEVRLIGRPVGVSFPFYQLYAKDPHMIEGALLAKVDYENQAFMVIGATDTIEYRGAYGDPTQVIFTIRAMQPGQTEVWVGVTGDLLYGDPGSIDWAGESTHRVQITVSP